MRNLFSPALVAPAALVAAGIALSGCGYFPVPPDPIRILTAQAEVSTCRRLGGVGLARTDGEAPYSFGYLTAAAPRPAPPAFAIGQPYAYGGVRGREIVGPNFAVRLNVMRDAALARGATDLLLSRRVYRDWSYVEGIAYRCRV